MVHEHNQRQEVDAPSNVGTCSFRVSRSMTIRIFFGLTMLFPYIYFRPYLA